MTPARRPSSPLARLLLVWWAVAFVSACLIYGPDHADEWYQITAWYLARLGLHDPAELPWEYASQIRSWLQPGFYAALFGPFILEYGFHLIWVERLMLITQWLLLGIGLWAFRPLLAEVVPRDRRIYRWGALSLASVWFMPSMLVRHASEAFSIVLLVLGLRAWLHVARSPGPQRLAAFACGMLLGFAFWARFLTAFFSAGFLPTVGLAGDARERRALVYAALGVAFSLLLGALVDRWGYEQWVLSPWNFFFQNIVADRAKDYGTYPFYYYIGIAMAFTLSPVLWFWVVRGAQARRTDGFTRALGIGALVFVLAHSFVAHKEPRFLLPAAPALILLALHGLANPPAGRLRWAFDHRLSRAIVLLNLLALVVYSSFGLVRARRGLDPFLWAERPTAIITAQVVFGAFDEVIAPFDPRIDGFGRSFVKPPGMRVIGAYPEQFGSACRAHPEALVILCDRDRRRDGQPSDLIERPMPSIAHYPSPEHGLPIPRKRWRFRVVPCARYPAATALAAH